MIGSDAEGNMERIIAFDVETPNAQNHRMSAIGIAVIEDMKVIRTGFTLINPETWFDRFNIDLTGITPETAAKAPTFPEIWGQIRPMFENGILAAHNAPFDMRVLARCVQDYGLDASDELRYLCTVRMGRICYPELSNHRLETLCRYRGIRLNHHRADSDSLACAELILDYIEHGMEPMQFVRRYDLRRISTIREYAGSTG